MAKKLGLALGSGADRGFAHIGILKVLTEHQIPVHCISGTSMGSLVAAYYALHGEVAALEKLARELTKTQFLKLVDLNNPLKSVIKGNKIRDFLMQHLFGDATFADVQMPLFIGATALEDGTLYSFTKGRIVDAVIASCSIPGILPPYEIDGKHLVDGGLADAVPLSALDTMGAEVRVGIDLYAYTPVMQDRFTAKDVIDRTYRLFLSKLSAHAHYEDDARTIILRPETNEGIETLTFTRAVQNIAIGEALAREHIDAIQKLCQPSVRVHTGGIVSGEL